MNITLAQHIQNFFITETGVLVNTVPEHLIIATNVICTGIELLGKIYDISCKLNEPNKSRKHFENALQLFSSLTKYNSAKDKDGKCALYTDVRCAFSHGLMNGAYINLTSHVTTGILFDNNKYIIGIKELYDDFVCACKMLLTSTNPQIQSRLNSIVYSVF